jgi:dGTPase
VSRASTTPSSRYMASCPGDAMVHEVIRRMIHVVASDLIEESARRIAAAKPADIDAVRAQPGPLIGFSEARRPRAPRDERSSCGRGSTGTRRCRRRASAPARCCEDFSGIHGDVARMPPEHRDAAVA